ncbi:MAG: right-handed parallel beta-helix repeat-containing protein [Aquabacterium sp.]|nr:right-handed parallel beta-helix repeat-containing protein [Aquabacterium sp.]
MRRDRARSGWWQRCHRVVAALALSLPLWMLGTPQAQAAQTPKVFHVSPGTNASAETLKAIFYASEGDIVEFGEGNFEFPSGLIIHGKRGLTIRGAGKDKTRLSFKNSNTAEGINASHCEGITIEDLEVIDTPGNGIRVYRSKYVTLRRIKAGWSDADPVKPGYQTKPSNGFYAIYPVMVQQLLVEDTYSYGSVDAGLYVGQSSDVIVRRNEARYNVIGIELENVQRGLVEQNLSTENTAGFLAYDLEGLSQFGDGNVVRNNRFVANNVKNFGAAGFVKDAPPGTGAIIAAEDNLEFYGNELADNATTGLLIVNYGFVNSKATDKKLDWFNEAVNVHHNTFRNNGKSPPKLDLNDASTTITALIGLKGFGVSAHIITDGQVDKANSCSTYPVDKDGIALNKPNPSETDRVNPRQTSLGAPGFGLTDPQPGCHYNDWKFNATTWPILGTIKKLKEENRICITDNSYDVSVPPYLNANVQNGELTNLLNFLPGDRNLLRHACKLRSVPLPTVKLPYVLPDNVVRQPTMEEAAAVCGAAPRSQTNFALAARFNCPQLDQYALFRDPQDPRSGPMGSGVPYELTSTLFTNYAAKYRFIFIPPGKQAVYRDSKTGFKTSKPAGVTDGAWYPAAETPSQSLATLAFPTGTIIAKTFTFKRENASGQAIGEDLIETRLLIKRDGPDGPFWMGLPYIWEKGADGKLVARLTPQGAELQGRYDYLDHDPEVKDATGQRVRYTGEVKQYGVPSAMACVVCHGSDKSGEAGAAPIGPKAKFLNRLNPALGNQNQLLYMKAQGLLSGLPESLASVERAPRWNVPGDAGQTAGSPQDIQVRARSYLEANCASCHNPGGEAANSGLFLQLSGPLNQQSGVCKKPVAAGRGAGGIQYDLVPGKPEESVLLYRVASSENGVRMPPIGRTIPHAEGVKLLSDWIKVMQPDDPNAAKACQ